MSQSVEINAVAEDERAGIDIDQRAAGVATAGVRPIVLVRSKVPLNITPGPTAHAVCDLLKIRPYLIADPGATRMLGQIISLGGIPAGRSEHRAGRATVSVPSSARNLRGGKHGGIGINRRRIIRAIP